MKTKLHSVLIVLALIASVHCAPAQNPVITSFDQNGVLVCSNLNPGSVAAVAWAATLTGPWQTNLTGLNAAAVATNGMLQVSVPMNSRGTRFYRVFGVAAPPAGMVLIPAGSFTMGDTINDYPGGDETPTHTVYVSAIYMDKYDVTKSLWDSVYAWAITHGYNFDYAGSGKALNHPVQTVDWYDCVKWCNARSEMEGRTPAYYTNAAQTTVYRTGQSAVDNSWVKWNAGYRLPTEAEWEKAARGGASGQRFPWGNTISWSQATYYAYPLSLNPLGYAYDVNPMTGYDPAYNDGVYPYTSPVNAFAPNGYGLYDMAGNVWQQCWDWYGSYGSASQTDPRGPTSGSGRVFRGGGWDHDAIYCRVADRDRNWPDDGDSHLGCRSVLSPGQ